VAELLNTCHEIVRTLENPSETTTYTTAAAQARRIVASYADMVPRSDLDRIAERVRDLEGRLARRRRR
jgi:hypothetical protein